MNRLNARVSIRSLGKALSSGISPSTDVCVILPGHSENDDVLDRILAEASAQACGTMILRPEGPPEADEFAGSDAMTAVMTRRLPATEVATANMTVEEITGRIKALCEVRRPLQRMRDELERLRQRDAELTCGARQRDEQLRLAGQIQHDLLPNPDIDSWPLEVSTLFIPADHVSGDIYEVARLDEERFGFSIADATGHGLPAALLTILIKNSLRGKEIVDGRYRLIEPDELLGRLNAELLATNLSGCQFITGLHAIFDRTNSRIRWARGGAPYPVLIRPGEAPRCLRTSGGLIGVLDNQRFEVASEDLHPGDLLLFYTDGLEALVLGPSSASTEPTILDSDWLMQLAVEGPEAAFAVIEDLAKSPHIPPWSVDDITAIALRMNA